MTKESNDSTLQLPASLSGVQTILLGGGGAALAVGMIMGITGVDDHGSHAMHAYMTAFMFCLSISLGALFFVVIQHLCRAGWSASVRRIAEILMVAIPALSVLFLPILIFVLLIDDSGKLYPWSLSGWGQAHPEKSKILNPGAFLIVSLIVFGLWSLIARYFWDSSRKQDSSGDIQLTERMQFWSGPATVTFALTVSAAAFVWIMSLDPMWFSTMFGVYIFAGCMVSFFAMMSLSVYVLQKKGAIVDEVNQEHYHDFGKYTFGFVVFWAYIAFSQYMLIWYANIPEETTWLLNRQGPPDDGFSGWGAVSLALPIVHWLIPFFAVMPRHLRRTPKWMAFWGAYLLLAHYFDLYWIIMPEAGISHAITGGPLGLACSLLCFGGMVGLYLGVLLRIATGIPLIPVKDPRLPQALAFENI